VRKRIAYVLLLLSQRERWRSIVKSASVCVAVCLSASISPEPHGDLCQMFCAFVYGRGLVLLRRDDAIPRGRVNLWGFLLIGSVFLWAI